MEQPLRLVTFRSCMNKPASLLLATLGAVMLWLTHHGILEGKILVGKGTIRAVLITDSSFWFHAGAQFALGQGPVNA